MFARFFKKDADQFKHKKLNEENHHNLDELNSDGTTKSINTKSEKQSLVQTQPLVKNTPVFTKIML